MKYLAGLFLAFFFTHNAFAATLGPVEKQKQALERHRGTIHKSFQEGLSITLTQANDIKMIAGGFSKADLFKVTTRQGNFIVKIMKDSPQEDIETEITAAQITGDVGVGPKLYYSHLKNKTLVLAYIDNNNGINRRAAPFHKMVAHKIRAFHDSKPLNRDRLFFDILRQDEQRLVNNGLISSFVKEEDATLYAERATEVEAIFAHFFDDIRPVHHDISPHNVLYDKKKAWLIDWETASNDYYPIDLCMFANFHVYDESLLPQFMQAYYGRKPTALEMAKFHVIRPFCYAFHGFRLAFLSNQKTLPKLGDVMEYKKFQLAIRQGDVQLGSPKSLFALAVSTMNKATLMLQSSEFKEGLRVLKTHLKDKGIKV